jgi:hypothetical protein
VPSMLGTIAGAGMPPAAALSPGIPSSGGESNAPSAQSGCRHPNNAHAGSSCALAGTITEWVTCPMVSRIGHRPDGEESGRFACQPLEVVAVDLAASAVGRGSRSRSIRKPDSYSSSQVCSSGASRYRTRQPRLQVSSMTRTSK